MLFTRRDMGKIALAGIPLAKGLAAIDSKFGGVQIGAISFPQKTLEATVTVVRAFYRADDLREQRETVAEHWYWKDGRWWVKP